MNEERLSTGTEIATDTDTRLFVLRTRTELPTTTGKRIEYGVAVTLLRETGYSVGDGEQTTYLNAEQLETLIKKLTSIKEEINTFRKLDKIFGL